MSTVIPLDAGAPFDNLRQTRPDGSEYWSARDLMGPLGYDKWERFAGAVDPGLPHWLCPSASR